MIVSGVRLTVPSGKNEWNFNETKKQAISEYMFTNFS